MADTMRERIAAAIAKRCGDEPYEVMTYPTSVRGQYREAPVLSEYLEFADNVLAAMREPTEAMVEEGAYVVYDDVEGPSTATCTAFRKAWQAAIDAARNEQQDREANG
jgi:hypothetical protein